MTIKNQNRGFTLIELLVVIAIIGVLAAIVLVSLNSARVKSRDARRIADVRQMETALALYYNDNNQYPLSTGATSPNSGWSNSNDSSWATLQAAMSPYMASLPIDPKQSSIGWPVSASTYTYVYYSDSGAYGCTRKWYMIVYQLETPSGPDPGVIACNGTKFQYGGTGASTTIKTVGVNGY